MENFNNNYRNTLAEKLKEIKKESPEEAAEYLSVAQETEDYKLAKYEHEQELAPVEVMDLLIELGKDIERKGLEIKAMFEIAKERGVIIDLSKSERFKKFNVMNEYEIELQKLSNELGWVASEITEQGLLVTQKEVNDVIEKMN